MVYRWQCRHCEWTTWSASEEETVRAGKSHLVSHYQDNVSKSSFGLQWTCPYCDREDQVQDPAQGIDRFKQHLFSHAESLIESGVHVANDVGGTGSILVLSALEGTGANNARKHFLSAGDIMVFVTTQPARRIRMVREELGELPSWTVIVTTQTNPLAELSGADPETLPVDVLKLDGTGNLATLGQMVSHVLDDHKQAAGKISFEFDILSELIAKFDVQQVFKFLHVLTARLEEANALSHFYANPSVQEEATVNVLTQVFDLQLAADGRVFTSRPGAASDG